MLLLFLEAELIRSSAISFEVFRSFRADVVSRDVGHRRSAVLLAKLGPRFVFMVSVWMIFSLGALDTEVVEHSVFLTSKNIQRI